MLKYFTRIYNFDFFLRVDDDYFVCLHHLLTELPHRPTTALYWGWIHCNTSIVRVDEGFMILTYDIIKDALSRLNTSLMCSGTGDQAVPLWLADGNLEVTYFYDNSRLIHEVTGNKIREYLVSGLCDRYIGLHGAYPKHMYQYWRMVRQDRTERYISEDGRFLSVSRLYHFPRIIEFSEVCMESKEFDWKGFNDPWRFEPKPCKDEPMWSLDEGEYKGRGNDD